MRTIAAVPLLAALLAGCAGRQTAWTTLASEDVPDGADAFVLVDRVALHLKHVEVDDQLRGRVVRAWLVPAVGVAALAVDDRTTSPEEIADHAGWSELRLASRDVKIPLSQIRSVRATVDVMPDEDVRPDHPPLAAVAFASLFEYLLDPCCHRCRRP